MGRNVLSVSPSSPMGAAGLTSLSALQYKAKNPEVQRQKLAQVCAEVEGVFLTQLLQQMRKTFVSSVSPRQKSMELYSDLYERQVAQALANGGGIGLARRLYQNLQNRIAPNHKENQDEVIRTASPDTSGDHLVPGTPGLSGTGSPGPGGSPGGDDPEPGRF
jgi:flagellar protein FlgJ